MVCYVKVSVTLPNLYQNSIEQIFIDLFTTLLNLIETLVKHSSAQCTKHSLSAILFRYPKYVKV